MRQIIILLILWYLRFWAKLALWLHKPKVIGITGSVGKSSCRDMVYAALKDNLAVKMIEKGNSETGIPLGIVGLEVSDNSFIDWLKMLISAPLRINYLKGVGYLVVEMGVDEPYPPKNMEYLLSIVNPDISVFLNVFPVHSMQFDQLVPDSIVGQKRVVEVVKKIAEEKGKIFSHSSSSVCIYNSDNKYVKNTALNLKRKTKLLSFGQSTENQVFFGDYILNGKGTKFDLYISSKKNKITVFIDNYLLPKAYQELIAATILVGQSLSIPVNLLISSLEKNFRLPPGRATIFDGVNNSIIIDSSYNASRAAVLSFLKMAGELKEKTDRPVIFIFGDMRELGKESEIEHLQIAKTIPEIVDYLYCVGEQTKKFVLPKVKDKLKEALWFSNAKEAGQYVKNKRIKNAIILIKGSQNTIFLEEAVKELLLKKSDIKKLCRQSDFWMTKKIF